MRAYKKNVIVPRNLAEYVIILSLPITFTILVLTMPPTPFYALLVVSISLAAVLYEFVGGTLVSLMAMAGVITLIALESDPVRRAATLTEAAPILIMYLAIGPLIGWIARREHKRHQAAAAENAHLFEVERQRSSHLAAIGEASREIAASLDLERTLRLVMAKAAETLPMDAGALFQFDEQSKAFHVAVSHNLSPDYVSRITFVFEEGVPGWVVRHRRTLIIPDATQDRRVHPYVVEDGVQSVMAVPLVVHEQVVGVLNLYSKTEKNPFDEIFVQLAEVFAAQAAVAIENSRLVGELRQAAAELEAKVRERTCQLREKQEQIVRAEKLAVVGRLAASVAHEVNNPLQSMALQLQLITKEGMDISTRNRITIVQDEVARIARIIQRLLDLQRPNPGEHSLQDVDELLDDVLALVGKQLQRSNVRVIREGTEGLPPVMGVVDQLKQVFLNLVLNAIEAMPKGGKLHIRTGMSDGMICVVFGDTGVGIAPETLQLLFDPFFSTKPDGTGLGLTVSHEIVTQHGGRIEVTSAPGERSTFTVRLPAVVSEEG